VPTDHHYSSLITDSTRLLLTANPQLLTAKPLTAMATVFQDFRYALRLLVKSPGFTILAVLTLGVGIGANVTVFSVLNVFLLRSLPLPHRQQLVRLYSEWEPAWPYSAVSAPDFLDCRARNTTFSE
jgi:putative ABC transport system permease protein